MHPTIDKSKYAIYSLHKVIYKLPLKGIFMINKVKLARVEKDLTQAQLAQKVGVTRQTIGLIEKNEYNPSLQLCISIAKTLDKTLNDLFWEDVK